MSKEIKAQDHLDNMARKGTPKRAQTPFDALTHKQREKLEGALYQVYDHDIEQLIREFLRRHSADDLKAMLTALDEMTF